MLQFNSQSHLERHFLSFYACLSNGPLLGNRFNMEASRSTANVCISSTYREQGASQIQHQEVIFEKI